MKTKGNYTRNRKAWLTATAILVLVAAAGHAAYAELQSRGCVLLSTRMGNPSSDQGKMYVDVSISTEADAVSDVSSIAIGLSNEYDGWKFRSWKQSARFDGKSFLVPSEANGRKILFLTAIASQPLKDEVIELGTIEYEVVGKGTPNANSLQLVVGDLLTPEGQILHVKEAEVETMGREPVRSSLEQNVPNPFNPETTIRYTVTELADVELKIYSVDGRLIRTLVSENQVPDVYKVVWDGKNDLGEPVASGVYFYRLKMRDQVSTKKLVLLR